MKKSIAVSTLKITIIMFAIKILGVIKQSIIAAVCGASNETDAYFISTGVISALCTVVFSAVSISFLSMYTDRLTQEGRKKANSLVSNVLMCFIPFSLVIFVLFLTFAPYIAKFLAPNYTDEQNLLLSNYIRIMSIMFVFSAYYLIINVALECEKIFLPGKLLSLFQNFFIIVAAVCFYRYIGMKALVFAFVIAGMVQCIQITWSARRVYKFSSKCAFESKSIKKLLILALPLFLGNAVYEVNDIVDKRIASNLGSGSVSFLSFGASLNEMVVALIISSISTVLFSHFATYVSNNDIREITKTLVNTLELVTCILLPITAVCIFNGNTIVKLLYGRGDFDENAQIHTNFVLIGYAFGFVFQAGRSVVSRVYYAFKDTKTPMINGMIAVIINIVLSVIFSQIIGIGGVALATSVSMFIVTLLLLKGLNRFLPNFSLRKRFIQFFKMCLAFCVILALSVIAKNLINLDGILGSISLSVVQLFLYLIICIILNVECLSSIRNRIIRHN